MGRRRGFSLVELLVVIGIIAVLMSLLLPTLHRARESARSVQCANNVRSIWQAATAYAADYDGSLPYGPRVPTDTWHQGAGQVAYFLLGPTKPVMIDFAPKHAGAIIKRLGDTGLRGGTAASTLRCSNAEDGTANFSYTFRPELGGTGGTAGGDHDADDLPAPTGSLRLSRILNPGTQIVVFEQDDPTSGLYPETDPSGKAPSIHHFRTRTDGWGNYGFADGHVESIFFKDMRLKVFPLFVK